MGILSAGMDSGAPMSCQQTMLERRVEIKCHGKHKLRSNSCGSSFVESVRSAATLGGQLSCNIELSGNYLGSTLALEHQLKSSRICAIEMSLSVIWVVVGRIYEKEHRCLG